MWYTVTVLYFITEDKNMCLFRKPEKPKYCKVIAITLGAVAAVAAIAYFVYKFFFEYNCDCCEDYLDECDCDCDCECECCDEEIEVEDVAEEAAE